MIEGDVCLKFQVPPKFRRFVKFSNCLNCPAFSFALIRFVDEVEGGLFNLSMGLLSFEPDANLCGVRKFGASCF